MTAVAGIISGDRVTLAADRQVWAGWTKGQLSAAKLWHVKDLDAVVGACGTLRGLQVVRYEFTWPAHGSTYEDPLQYLVEAADELRQHLGNNGAKRTCDGVDHAHLALLMAWRGGLYEIGGDFSVLQLREQGYKYAAVGSGQELCLGALHATVPSRPLSAAEAQTRLLGALRAASHHGLGVGPPYDVMATGTDGKLATIEE